MLSSGGEGSVYDTATTMAGHSALTTTFQTNVGQPASPRFYSSTCFRTAPYGTSGTGFHGPDVISVTQPINSVKALKETQSIDPTSDHDLILSSSTSVRNIPRVDVEDENY